MAKRIPALYRSDGSVVLPADHPNPMTATFLRGLYVHADIGTEGRGKNGQRVMVREQTYVRIQVPFSVHLNILYSEAQVEERPRVYYLYSDVTQPGLAAAFVHKMWHKWEKFPKYGRDAEWPKCAVDPTASMEIDDKTFNELWRAAKKRKYVCGGDPLDPFVFTTLDNSVSICSNDSVLKGLKY